MSKKSKTDNFDEWWAKKQKKRMKAGKSRKSERGKEKDVLRSYEKRYSN